MGKNRKSVNNVNKGSVSQRQSLDKRQSVDREREVFAAKRLQEINDAQRAAVVEDGRLNVVEFAVFVNMLVNIAANIAEEAEKEVNASVKDVGEVVRHPEMAGAALRDNIAEGAKVVVEDVKKAVRFARKHPLMTGAAAIAVAGGIRGAAAVDGVNATGLNATTGSNATGSNATVHGDANKFVPKVVPPFEASLTGLSGVQGVVESEIAREALMNPDFARNGTAIRERAEGIWSGFLVDRHGFSVPDDEDVFTALEKSPAFKFDARPHVMELVARHARDDEKSISDLSSRVGQFEADAGARVSALESAFQGVADALGGEPAGNVSTRDVVALRLASEAHNRSIEGLKQDVASLGGDVERANNDSFVAKKQAGEALEVVGGLEDGVDGNKNRSIDNEQQLKSQEKKINNVTRRVDIFSEALSEVLQNPKEAVDVAQTSQIKLALDRISENSRILKGVVEEGGLGHLQVPDPNGSGDMVSLSELFERQDDLLGQVGNATRLNEQQIETLEESNKNLRGILIVQSEINKALAKGTEDGRVEADTLTAVLEHAVRTGDFSAINGSDGQPQDVSISMQNVDHGHNTTLALAVCGAISGPLALLGLCCSGLKQYYDGKKREESAEDLDGVGATIERVQERLTEAEEAARVAGELARHVGEQHLDAGGAGFSVV